MTDRTNNDILQDILSLKKFLGPRGTRAAEQSIGDHEWNFLVETTADLFTRVAMLEDNKELAAIFKDKRGTEILTRLMHLEEIESMKSISRKAEENLPE